MRVFAFLAVVGLFGSQMMACSSDDDDGGECSNFNLDLDCTPQYEPTFDNIFTNSITPNCAPPGSACHAAEGARAGLILEDADQSFDLLTGSGNDVIAGDPCESELGFRIASQSAAAQMPPGNPLSPGEQCAIMQWIADGAQR